ncbi:MAG: hypothetical protein NC336_07290 [Clostridium sp.]|nr:hypothetical protein [Clostridium sp.]
MTPKELYEELQKPVYGRYPYNRSGCGDGMEIVEEVISNYWRERFLVNHNAREAYELMNRELTLTFLTEQDVDWESVATLENSRNAYRFSAYYQRFAVGLFSRGVSLVTWTIYPDGMYFMDDDGFGMEDNEASILYGFIDRRARVVVPFQARDGYKCSENALNGAGIFQTDPGAVACGGARH